MNRLYLLLGTLGLLAGALVLTTGTQVPVHTQEIQTAPADTLRRPLRLLMVGLGQEMSRIGDGIWHEDYEMIRQGARAVANHPRVTVEEMAAIKNALNEQFPVFVGHDQAVHQTATQLAVAAQAQNMEDILRLKSELTQSCTTCHAAFRDDVRNALY